jgi:hypothetical protein
MLFTGFIGMGELNQYCNTSNLPNKKKTMLSGVVIRQNGIFNHRFHRFFWGTEGLLGFEFPLLTQPRFPRLTVPGEVGLSASRIDPDSKLASSEPKKSA